MHRMILALGETDCEQVGAGWLAQPVNALTSLVFSVIGVAVIGWARGVAGIERRLKHFCSTASSCKRKVFLPNSNCAAMRSR